MSKIRELKIDPEFESLIPPLTDEEFKQLRENIIEDGEVREPLVTWRGTILDGHNRWKVIQEEPDIPFKTMEMIFMTRNEAKAWMIRNQLGRRNLPNYERARLALELKPILAGEAKKRQGERNDLKDENIVQIPAPSKVRDELAKVAGVSHDTISKVEKIEAKAPPEVKEQLRRGEVSINKAYQEVRQMEQPKAEPPKQPEYTLDNLLQEVSASGDNYIRFLKDTLVKRSTMYAEQSERNRVHDAVCSIKNRIEEIVNLLN